MARKSLEQRIEQLEEQKRKLQALKNKQERIKDTRRKMMLGSLVLAQLEKRDDPFTKQLTDILKKDLPNLCIRPADHELFSDILGDVKATSDVITIDPMNVSKEQENPI